MGQEDKRWRLVCYDIRDPERYRKIYRIVTGHGHRLQYSLFRCRLDDQEVEKLRWRLAQVMAAEDSLLIIDLCPSCASRAVSKNQVDDWSPEPVPFRLVGGKSSGDHEPDGGGSETP
ncbi:MAG: CRISPR-associated endonuclease Cas2 [Sandaracinaceae bacterium]|nr:CRISPR-associated endonuclease Cas2 [Sandaracinaceae bacterium]